MNTKIYRFESVGSTNTKLKELVHRGGAQSGTVVYSKEQTEGRGRLGRSWYSPLGGLYCSVLLVPKNAKRLTDFSLLAGVAVCQTVKSILPKSKDVSVKWPNDCLVDWKKIAGVLCETVGEPPSAVIVGMGINVNLEKDGLAAFKGNPFPATSMQIEAEGEYEVDSVFDTLMTKFFELYRTYEEQGYPIIKYLWEKNCLMMGKKIELHDPGYRPEDGDRGKTVGVFLGIDESGALVISNQKNEKRSYVSGEITCCWP